MDALLDGLAALAGEAQVRTHEPMHLHTTFRVGGPADYYIEPKTIESLASLLVYCKEKCIPYYLIGNGSNLLVSDEGFRGVIINPGANQRDILVEGTTITAQAGALLSAIAKAALDHALTGFEFAAGIPGTLGGACVMNAGAYGGEMKDVLTSVSILGADGQVCTLPVDALALGYRTSRIAKNHEIVLSAKISLEKGDAAEIADKMKTLARKRREKQPLEYGSAGSTFKRPEGQFAGKLIEDAGLRGFQIGGAAVSEKHCGFLINKDNATATDLYRLLLHVQQEVQTQSGILLEPEIKLLGFTDNGQL